MNSFDEPTNYIHTPEGCTPGGGVNCEMLVTFCPKNTAYVAITDIINKAQYTLSGNSIVISRDGPGDIPELSLIHI